MSSSYQTRDDLKANLQTLNKTLNEEKCMNKEVREIRKLPFFRAVWAFIVWRLRNA